MYERVTTGNSASGQQFYSSSWNDLLTVTDWFQSTDISTFFFFFLSIELIYKANQLCVVSLFVPFSCFHWNLPIHWALKKHLGIQGNKMNLYCFSWNNIYISIAFLPETQTNGILKDKEITKITRLMSDSVSVSRLPWFNVSSFPNEWAQILMPVIPYHCDTFFSALGTVLSLCSLKGKQSKILLVAVYQP